MGTGKLPKISLQFAVKMNHTREVRLALVAQRIQELKSERDTLCTQLQNVQATQHAAAANNAALKHKLNCLQSVVEDENVGADLSTLETAVQGNRDTLGRDHFDWLAHTVLNVS